MVNGPFIKSNHQTKNIHNATRLLGMHLYGHRGPRVANVPSLPINYQKSQKILQLQMARDYNNLHLH